MKKEITQTLADRVPSAGEVDAALTYWYPGEWPDSLGLPGGPDADEAFRVRARGEMSEAIRAAEAVRLAEAGAAK